MSLPKINPKMSSHWKPSHFSCHIYDEKYVTVCWVLFHYFYVSDPTCNEVQQSSLSPTPSHSSQSSVFSVSTPTARITTSSALVTNSWSYMFPSVSAVSSASTALALQSSIAVQCQGTFADTLTAVRYLIQGCWDESLHGVPTKHVRVTGMQIYLISFLSPLLLLQQPLTKC